MGRPAQERACQPFTKRFTIEQVENRHDLTGVDCLGRADHDSASSQSLDKIDEVTGNPVRRCQAAR